MPELKVANRTLAPQAVKPVAKGQELAAARALRENGADDVLVKVGEDYFVASGRGMNVGKLKTNDVVTLDGKSGHVVAVDKQLNTFWEGMTHKAGLITGGAITAYGVFGFVQGVMAGANMAGLGLIIAAAGVVAGLAINLVPAIFGAARKVEI